MIRSLLFGLTVGLVALLAFAAPEKVAAQYPGSPAAPRYTPYQPPYGRSQPGPSMEDLRGTWFLFGDEEDVCQIIPSRLGNRALFINEKGERAEGYMRGSRIFVPAWKNLEGRFRGDTIRWSNNSVWSR